MPWWTAPPAIVAEALVGVPDPLLTALRPGPLASSLAVAASLAGSLRPAEDSAEPPPWLLPEQTRSFRRALAAIRRHGGAVLADPVGSGKTYVALAVASAFNGRATTACLVPATLLSQWEAVAANLGVAVALVSHEQVSRGRLPERTRGLVIVDESHRFRNRQTRRYTHLSRWLVGRPALLVTATPIVNRLDDLAHQLWLAVRDNALVLDGIGSLRSLLAAGCASAALGQLVVQGDEVPESRPRKASRISTPTLPECRSVTGAITTLGRLRLSSHESIAALVRGVLLRAAGSSPAALAGALHRYRRLLLHARDAFQARRSIERSELRRFTADLGDQLIWWELLPSNGSPSDLELGDLAELGTQIKAADAAAKRADAKLDRLRELLEDGKPTLVFTCSRDTVRYICERLGHLGLAWCTGEKAGIGASTLTRLGVLAWFRPPAPEGPGPRHLIVTDVAAEGLDLQRAARVVHYDLPWTPMRLEQREGRAIRLGSRHPEVEVIRFAAPPSLERSLRIEAALSRKAKLPASAGLGSSGRRIWRWRTELAARFSGAEAVAGAAAVVSGRPGILAGFALHRAREPGTCLAASVGWLEPGGVWNESPEIVAERLVTAAGSRTFPADAERLRSGLALLMDPIRERLAVTRGQHWVSPDLTPSARQLAVRLNHLIGQAARRRQSRRLMRLGRALGFVAGGHTAGETLLIERLAAAGDGEIESELSRLPHSRLGWDELEVRLTGLILFVERSSLSPIEGGE